MSRHPEEAHRAAPHRRSAGSIMSRCMKPAHKRASRVLGYALTLDSSASWYAASAVWRGRLTAKEAAALAWAALKATEPHLEQMVAEASLRQAGMPLPTFEDVISEAGFWADMANRKELSAYAVACINRFTATELIEFRDFLARL